jgi:hypothetical protein
MPRVLRNLKITEVSSVDKAANPGARITLFKRDGAAPDDTDSTGDAAYAEALRWLLHTRRGAAMLRRVFPRGVTSIADLEALAQRVMRLRANTRAEPRDSFQPWPDAKPNNQITAKGFPMNRTEHVRTVIKLLGGFDTFLKRAPRYGTEGLSEHEITAAATDAAARELPNLTREQAFVQKYGADRKFWAAITISNNGVPPVEWDDDEDEEDEDEEETGDAVEEIAAKARELRRRDPTLTAEQAFAKAYSDPANRELAKRERRQNGF